MILWNFEFKRFGNLSAPSILQPVQGSILEASGQTPHQEQSPQQWERHNCSATAAPQADARRAMKPSHHTPSAPSQNHKSFNALMRLCNTFLRREGNA